MKSKRCFTYLAVRLAGVLLTGARMVGTATPQVGTKEVNYEPAN